MEKFKCKECGFEIEVEFGISETRDVPCGGCYYEEWSIENGKIIHGAIIVCEKGKGI